MKISNAIILTAGILTAVACSNNKRGGKLIYHVVSEPAYDSVFSRIEGWTGGDIASTVPLSDSLILWLFGDTWVGRVDSNRHINATMINNSVALQKGRIIKKENLYFFYQKEGDKPASLFTPEDGRGFYWLTGGGIKTKTGFHLIASQIVKKENDTTVFGFESVGNSILTIENPDDLPVDWKYTATRIPFYKNTDSVQVDFGIPQFIKDGFIYIFGVEFNKKQIDRYMLLARVPEDKLTETGSWKFYSAGKWVNDFNKAERLFNRFGAEYSVSYQPFLKKYIAVYSELGLSKNVMIRTADNPEGPWSEQELIYQTPEAEWDKDYFCYAARGHSEISGTNDLLISYICNSMDFWKMAADARIYRPRFIRIIFENK